MEENQISKRKLATIEAYNRGFRIRDSKAFNPKGKQVIGYKRISKGNLFYWHLGIKIGKISYSVPFHTLLAYEKFGDKILDEGIHIRHLNGNSLDNSWQNIDIGSQSENMMDRDPLERAIHALKTSWHNRKFSDEQIRQIKIDRENGMSYNKLSEKYNVQKSTLSFLFNHAIYYKYPNLEDAINFVKESFK